MRTLQWILAANRSRDESSLELKRDEITLCLYAYEPILSINVRFSALFVQLYTTIQHLKPQPHTQLCQLHTNNHFDLLRTLLHLLVLILSIVQKHSQTLSTNITYTAHSLYQNKNKIHWPLQRYPNSKLVGLFHRIYCFDCWQRFKYIRKTLANTPRRTESSRNDKVYDILLSHRQNVEDRCERVQVKVETEMLYGGRKLTYTVQRADSLKLYAFTLKKLCTYICIDGFITLCPCIAANCWMTEEKTESMNLRQRKKAFSFLYSVIWV